MSSDWFKRVKKEYEQLAKAYAKLDEIDFKSSEMQTLLFPKDSTLAEWTGVIKGPAYFITKVYHPNISSVTGCVCLSTLNEDWSPAYTLEAVLLCIQGLLASPDKDSPQDSQVNEIMKSNVELFNDTVKVWVAKYSLTPNESPFYEIQCIKKKGFQVPVAIDALVKNGWNVEKAADSLKGEK